MSWRDHLPAVRGKILKDEPLAPFTWFRVGGPAEVIFLPEDEDDLATFLKGLDPSVPVTPLGVGSNTLVRDGGLDGVVIRLGRAFARVEPRGDHRIYAGAAALDATVAREAAKAGIAGLEFFRGVPGAIGGACVMNAGCYGSETKDVLVEAYAMTRGGERVTLSNAEMGFSYRKSARAARGDLIFLGALFEGTPDDPAAIEARMNEITARREAKLRAVAAELGAQDRLAEGDGDHVQPRQAQAVAEMGKPLVIFLFQSHDIVFDRGGKVDYKNITQ
jgi:UDP-N-acetylmuramate dehydrogenase